MGGPVDPHPLIDAKAESPGCLKAARTVRISPTKNCRSNLHVKKMKRPRLQTMMCAKLACTCKTKQYQSKLNKEKTWVPTASVATGSSADSALAFPTR